MTVTDAIEDTLDLVYSEYGNDPAFNHLRKSARSLVKGRGSHEPLVVFIGEAPGAQEDKAGEPFVGPSGKFLNTLLHSINLTDDEVWITNIVKYRPQENRDPTYGEIINSKAYLDRELKLLDCNIIVPLGRHALSVFYPEHQLKDVHGRILREGDKYIIPQYHPAIGGIYNKAKYGPIALTDFAQIGIVLDSLGHISQQGD